MPSFPDMGKDTIHVGDYSLEDLTDQLRIDNLALDEELLKQPWLFGVIGDALVLEQDNRDSIKDELERKEAEVGLEIRKEFEDDGVSYTEAKLKSEVLTDPSILDLKEELQKAKTRVARIASLKEAFETRSRMLGHLARLYVSDYFGSSPAATTHHTDAKEVDAQLGRKAATATRREKTTRRKRRRH